MATEVYLLAGLLVVGATYVIVKVRQMMKYHGTMLVTCPENRKTAAVKVSWGKALRSALRGERVHLELQQCSRWPEMSKCEQDCVFQVRVDPEKHQIWSVAKEFFAGKKCAYCGKPIQSLSHFDDYPALLDATNLTTEWDKVKPQDLPEAFSTRKPICASCHALQTVIREHPEHVVFRPWERSGPLGEYTPMVEGEKPRPIERKM